MARIMNGKYVDNYLEECIETFKMRTKSKAGKRAFVSYVLFGLIASLILCTTPDSTLFVFGGRMPLLGIALKIAGVIATIVMGYILFFVPDES